MEFLWENKKTTNTEPASYPVQGEAFYISRERKQKQDGERERETDKESFASLWQTLFLPGTNVKRKEFATTTAIGNGHP